MKSELQIKFKQLKDKKIGKDSAAYEEREQVNETEMLKFNKEKNRGVILTN